jgi:hypothetical protein
VRWYVALVESGMTVPSPDSGIATYVSQGDAPDNAC